MSSWNGSGGGWEDGGWEDSGWEDGAGGERLVHRPWRSEEPGVVDTRWAAHARSKLAMAPAADGGGVPSSAAPWFLRDFEEEEPAPGRREVGATADDGLVDGCGSAAGASGTFSDALLPKASATSVTNWQAAQAVASGGWACVGMAASTWWPSP